MPIQLNQIPNTIDEAIDFIVNSLTAEEKLFLKEKESYNLIHHGIGTNIRNSWGLWKENSPINKDFQKRFRLFGHGDDLSGIIFDGVWAAVNEKDIEKTLNETAEKYRKHWEKHGRNPKTGKRI